MAAMATEGRPEQGKGEEEEKGKGQRGKITKKGKIGKETAPTAVASQFK